MTDQEIYNVAEWLVYNSEAVKLLIDKAPDRDTLENRIMYKVAENFRTLTPEKIHLAFQDERVKIVLHKYYLKEYDYEH